MSNIRINRKDLATGVVFVLIGLFFLLNAYRNLSMGTSLNMGPGYFPTMLAGLLILLGLGVAASGVSVENESTGKWPWRAIVCIGLAPILFALSIQSLGLVPAIFIISMIASFASRKISMRNALVLSILLAAFCYVIFVYLLGLPMPAFGALGSLLAGN